MGVAPGHARIISCCLIRHKKTAIRAGLHQLVSINLIAIRKELERKLFLLCHDSDVQRVLPVVDARSLAINVLEHLAALDNGLIEAVEVVSHVTTVDAPRGLRGAYRGADNLLMPF